MAKVNDIDLSAGPGWRYCDSFRIRNWGGFSVAMATLGNKLYVAANDKLYVMNFNESKRLEVQLSGAKTLRFTKAMVAIGTFLYIVAEDKLYKIDPESGSYERVGTRVWGQGTNVAMTASGNKLYIGANNKLFEADPSTGGDRQVGAKEWPWTKGMVAINDSLYIVAEDKLYKIDPESGSYERVGTRVWGQGTNVAITVLGGLLYIGANNQIFEVNMSTGFDRRIGDQNWPGTKAIAAIDNLLYVVAAADLFWLRRDIAPTIDCLNSETWGGYDVAMAKDSNHTLYVAANDKLYRMNATTRVRTEVQISGGKTLTFTKAMAAIGTFLYIVAEDKLYKIDPESGSCEQIGTRVWGQGTNVAMTANSDKLYIGANDQLFEVDPLVGSDRRVGTGKWPWTKAMASMDNFLYIVADDKLYKVDPQSGIPEQIGRDSWGHGTKVAIAAIDGDLCIAASDNIYRISVGGDVKRQALMGNSSFPWTKTMLARMPAFPYPFLWLEVLLVADDKLLRIQTPLIANRFCGGYYNLSDPWAFLQHSYVRMTNLRREVEKDFPCLGGIDGPENSYPVTDDFGDRKLAEILYNGPQPVRVTGGPAYRCGGIEWGLNGVCHQIANRVLFAANDHPILTPPSFWLSWLVWGNYGHNFAIGEMLAWDDYLSRCLEQWKRSSLSMTDMLLASAERNRDPLAKAMMILEVNERKNRQIHKARLDLLIDRRLPDLPMEDRGRLHKHLDDFIAFLSKSSSIQLVENKALHIYADQINSNFLDMLRNFNQILGLDRYSALMGIAYSESTKLLSLSEIGYEKP